MKSDYLYLLHFYFPKIMP